MGGVRITMEADGIAELQNILGGLNKKDAKNITKRAFVAMAGQVRDDLRSVEPVRKGGLKRGTKSKSTRGGGAIVFGAHPLAAHAAIVRKGTQERKTKKGAKRGSMPANAAMDNVLTRATGEYADRVSKLVLDELYRNVEGRVGRGRRK